MRFRLIWVATAVALAGLAACGGKREDYPHLLPTVQVLAEPAIPAHAADAVADESVGAALDARGQALARRAAALPSGSGDSELQRRADALRARAQALSKRSLDDETPACDDPANCTAATQ